MVLSKLLQWINIFSHKDYLNYHSESILNLSSHDTFSRLLHFMCRSLQDQQVSITRLLQWVLFLQCISWSPQGILFKLFNIQLRINHLSLINKYVKTCIYWYFLNLRYINSKLYHIATDKCRTNSVCINKNTALKG